MQQGSEPAKQRHGFSLRAPAVVGSLVLVLLVLGASAGAYALTRSPATKDGDTPLPASVSGGPAVSLSNGPAPLVQVQKTP